MFFPLIQLLIHSLIASIFEAFSVPQAEKEKTSDAPDWLCEYCGSYNRSDVGSCSKCGAGKEEAKTNYGMLHKLTGRLFVKK